MKRFLVKSYVSRLLAESELREVQVTFLSELNPETSSLPGRDPLAQLTVGHREAAVQVLGGHLVLVIESHSVGGTGGRGGTFLLQYKLVLLLGAAASNRTLALLPPEVLLLQNVCEGK